MMQLVERRAGKESQEAFEMDLCRGFLLRALYIDPVPAGNCGVHSRAVAQGRSAQFDYADLSMMQLLETPTEGFLAVSAEIAQ